MIVTITSLYMVVHFVLSNLSRYSETLRSALIAEKSKYQKLAAKDPLTNLANPRAFHASLETAIEQANLKDENLDLN